MLASRPDLHLQAALGSHQRDIGHHVPHDLPLAAALDLYQRDVISAHVPQPFGPRAQSSFKSSSPFSPCHSGQLHGSLGDTHDFLSRMNSSSFHPYARMVHDFRHAVLMNSRLHTRDHLTRVQLSSALQEGLKRRADDRCGLSHDFRSSQLALPDAFLSGRQRREPSLGLGLGSAETLHRLRRHVSSEPSLGLKRGPSGFDSRFPAFSAPVRDEARCEAEKRFSREAFFGLSRDAPPCEAAQCLSRTSAAATAAGVRKRSTASPCRYEECHCRTGGFDPSFLHRENSQRRHEVNWDVRENEIHIITSCESFKNGTESFPRTPGASTPTTKFLSSSRGVLQTLEVSSSDSALTAARQSLATSLTSSEKPAEVSVASEQGTDEPAERGLGNLGKTKPALKRREKLQRGMTPRDRGGLGTRPSLPSTTALRKGLNKMRQKLLETKIQAQGEPLGKAFRCSQCRYRTDRKNNLKRHVVTMHQKPARMLECCGVMFHSKASLRDHVTLFHRGGYRCQVCGRNFCRKALLRRHLTVHSGQKDFSCHLCGYATSHKSNLERHQRVHARKSSPLVPGFLSRQLQLHRPTAERTDEATTAFENERINNSTKNSVVASNDQSSGTSWGELLEQNEDSREIRRDVSPQSWMDRSSSSCESLESSGSSGTPRAQPSAPRPLDLDSSAGDAVQWECRTLSLSSKSGGEFHAPHRVLSRKLCFPNRLRETYPSDSGEIGDEAPGRQTASEDKTKDDTSLPQESEEHLDVLDGNLTEEAKENENPLQTTRSSAKISPTLEGMTDRASSEKRDDSESIQLKNSQQKKLQSKVRMCCRPYRCFGCGKSFARQEELRSHVCKAWVGSILDFSLISSVLKGCIKLSAREGDVTF